MENLNSHSTKNIKDVAKSPDAFVSSMDKGWKIVEKNKVAMSAVVAVLVAIGIGVTGYDWLKGRTENKANEEIYVSKKELQDALKQFEASTEQPDVKKEPVKVKTGDLEKDLGPQVAKFAESIKKHIGTKAAASASIELASVYAQYNQFDKSVELLEANRTKLEKDSLLFGLVSFQLGQIYLSSGQLEKSEGVFQALISNAKFSYLHANALLSQAVGLEKAGQKERAVEIFKRLSQDFADTEAGKSAKTYLRMM